MDHLEVLQAPGVLADEGGAPLDPLGLALRDAHVLRALLAYAGVVPEEPGSYTCQNCGASFDVSPSSLLEVGPFVDGELDDAELDAPFAFDAWHSIPAVRIDMGTARRIRFAERSVEDAQTLWRAAGSAVLRITPATVIAMGVVALGSERRSSMIADALANAPPRSWSAIVDLFHEAHYSARLVGVHRCAGCDARNDLDVPLERELPRGDVEPEPAGPPRLIRASRAAAGGAPRAPFPDLASFEELVRAAADAVYQARRVRNIDLFIDAGVPACDEGGEPLLGCYTPGAAPGEADLAIVTRPEIRLFYKTFQAEHRADPSFDLDHEIYETIDHEVTHHLHHLAGHDPLDDAERAEIAMERARIVGRREVVRRSARGFAEEIGGFLRTTWPLWAILAAASALAWCR